MVLALAGMVALPGRSMHPSASGALGGARAATEASRSTEVAVGAGSLPTPSAQPPDAAPLPDTGFLGQRRGAPAPATLTGYRWPFPNGRITQPFGPSPFGDALVDGQPFHDGLDLATFCGDRVAAAHDGIVLAAGRHYDQQIGWAGDLGPYLRRLDERHLWFTLPIVVVIDDGDGYRSVYAHFEQIVVAPGERVHTGELLGYEGATGQASGCHLHYGLFSPLETATFGILPRVVAKLLLPPTEIARIDPLSVLPPRLAAGPRTILSRRDGTAAR